MKRMIFTGILALVAGASCLAAANPPQPKSKGELAAIQAMLSAPDPDSRIKAADELITKFADTQFKDLALYVTAYSYQQKNDVEKMMVYAERAIEANPQHYQALLMLAEAIPPRTKEFDLDREDKLGRAEKYANTAMEILKTAVKPNPGITDVEWENSKKDLVAQAHQSLGMAAMTRKKYDVAIAEYKLANESAAGPEPAYQVRLAQAYFAAGKYDDAIATAEKVMAIPDAHPQVKQVAQAVRAASTQAKAKGGAAAPAAPAPPQVEVKKP